ncbi:unnamed protein product, partial [Didymodactylos carnosus]
QEAGLYGENGIMPIRRQLKQNNIQTPMLLSFFSNLNLSSFHRIEFITLFGLVLSIFMIIFKCLRTTFFFFILWLIYYSCFQVGGLFLWFQWDTLLLEAGFLTCIVAPLRIIYLSKRKQLIENNDNDFYHDRIVLWLIRWLAFRLLFASGIVKLSGYDRTWWNLTAMFYHYQSQCLPTPLSYYAHHISQWLHSLSTAFVYMIMSGTAILFFSPLRQHRLWAFYFQTFLQILILLTGNYNFFNLLTIFLCLSLVDDKWLNSWNFKSTVKNQNQKKSSLKNIEIIVKWIINLVLIFVYVYLTIKWFGIKWNSNKNLIETKIMFTPKQFDLFLKRFVPVCIFIGWCSLIFTITKALTQSIKRPKKFYKKLFHLIITAFYSIIAICLFFISLIPFSVIEKNTLQALPGELQTWYNKYEQYHIFNAYGLFRSMTGVDGRPELIIEGAFESTNSKGLQWKEYEFQAKPGILSHSPTFVAPHQPRLDWQMWFAALSNYQHEAWLANFLYRLLTNQNEVLKLIKYSPFANKPPKYLRVMLYRYNFTELGSSNWWKRELLTREWFPTISLDTQWFIDYIKHQDILQIKSKTIESSVLVTYLQAIRSFSDKINPILFTWFPVCFAFIILILKKCLYSTSNYYVKSRQSYQTVSTLDDKDESNHRSNNVDDHTGKILGKQHRGKTDQQRKNN